MNLPQEIHPWFNPLPAAFVRALLLGLLTLSLTSLCSNKALTPPTVPATPSIVPAGFLGTDFCEH